MMKLNITLTTIFIYFIVNLTSQNCFVPVSGSTLYSIDEDRYNGMSSTGFVTLTNRSSGNWKVVSTSGTADAVFTDRTGRISTLNVFGKGSITIHNTSTDVHTAQQVECIQTFKVEPYSPKVVPNPKLINECPLNLVVLIDESVSISQSKSELVIQKAVMALANELKASSSRMAIIEFDTNAKYIYINGTKELQFITPDFINGLYTYFQQDYKPIGNPINLEGGTNWEDALLKADRIKEADYILLLTDNTPTFYNSKIGISAGEGETFDLTALNKAVEVANNIKRKGKHIFIAALNFPSNVQSLQDISGTKEYTEDQGLSELLNSDYTVVTPTTLVKRFKDIATKCKTHEIPTMGQWGIINLTLLMLIFGTIVLRNESDQQKLSTS